MLDDPDEHRAHEEGLVLVVGDRVEFQHHVRREQVVDGEGMAAFEEPAGCAVAEAADAVTDEVASSVNWPFSSTRPTLAPFNAAESVVLASLDASTGV